MSKPFKSQFDLMAEAYGNVNYNKQRIINEDTAGKTVIGYPPSEDYEDAEHEDGEQAGHPSGSTELEARNARAHELALAKANAGIEDAEHAEPVAIVSMDTEEVGDCGSEDHADDSEMHMAQAELYKATEYAGKLSELLNGIDSLEGWTASKITRASDYLSSVYHWLDYETNGKGRFNTGYEDAPEHPAEDNQ